jgi:23S rRNA (guanosine2251-2'-O)-methyltransferase
VHRRCACVDRLEVVFVIRLPVIVVLDNIRSLYNTGAFFRTADACAIEKLVLCGITPRPDQGKRQAHAIGKTALGAESSVPWEYVADVSTAVSGARQRAYRVVAVETSAHAVDLYEWQPLWPVCLVFGHETDGVSDVAASLVDEHVRIPMLGLKGSLNVATAAGVVMYELLRRHRLDGGTSRG